MVHALSTRMLVLGAVCIFEPVNGYQLRRELLFWDVDEWANVNPGSIYSMLRTLVKQGAITRHEIDGDARGTAVYTSTPEGRNELKELVGTGFTITSPLDPTPFVVAWILANFLPRDEVRELFVKRTAALGQEIEGIEKRIAANESGLIPPHIVLAYQLQMRLLDATRAWIQSVVKVIEAGELKFEGEEHEVWSPPADYPGWILTDQAEMYRSVLERDERTQQPDADGSDASDAASTATQ